jgi:hypothetical protein
MREIERSAKTRWLACLVIIVKRNSGKILEKIFWPRGGCHEELKIKKFLIFLLF